MSWTAAASGTQTATVTTEHTLDTDTTNATYLLKVDMNNMAAGDVVQLRLYTKILSGDDYQVEYIYEFHGVQDESKGGPNKVSSPVASDIDIKATLKQTFGTSRDFKWSFLRQ